MTTPAAIFRVPSAALSALQQTGAEELEPDDPKNFPPGEVQIARTGIRNSLAITGGLIGAGGALGAAFAGIRALSGGSTVRVNVPTMIAFGAAAILGAGIFGTSKLIGPRSESALAAGIPTRALAEDVDQNISGRTEIVQCADGTFAILRDTSPVRSSGGGSSHSHSSGGSSRPHTSGGSSSYPTPHSGSTSCGDDSGSGHSGGSSSSGNSSSNGNPSYSDF